MKPGRELDALVAEKVMGFSDIREIDSITPDIQWVIHLDGTFNGRKLAGGTPLPPYSTDIMAAWEVVEKIGAGEYFCLSFYQAYAGPDGPPYDAHWDCQIGKTRPENIGRGNHGKGETAPHAICLAALKALGVPLT